MYKAPIAKVVVDKKHHFMDMEGNNHYFLSIKDGNMKHPFSSECSCGWAKYWSQEPDKKTHFITESGAFNTWKSHHKNVLIP